jgi:RecB family endonuclease NucS
MELLQKAEHLIKQAVLSNEMLVLVGDCYVEYFGRAASKLLKGKRMLLIKADKSFAIHQNKYLRPINYMMNAEINASFNSQESCLEVIAQKLKPKEKIKVKFYSIDFIKSFALEDIEDLRLFGSEEELSTQLLEDLSFIEQGLKPFKEEVPFRKGVIDILAEDINGNIVVIEVKRRKATLDAVSQLYRYKEQLSKIKKKNVRGLLLAPDITSNALKMLEDYGLEFFKFEFEVSNPKAKIKGLQKKQRTLFDDINESK